MKKARTTELLHGCKTPEELARLREGLRIMDEGTINTRIIQSLEDRRDAMARGLDVTNIDVRLQELLRMLMARK